MKLSCLKIRVLINNPNHQNENRNNSHKNFKRITDLDLVYNTIKKYLLRSKEQSLQRFQNSSSKLKEGRGYNNSLASQKQEILTVELQIKTV